MIARRAAKDSGKCEGKDKSKENKCSTTHSCMVSAADFHGINSNVKRMFLQARF